MRPWRAASPGRRASRIKYLKYMLRTLFTPFAFRGRRGVGSLGRWVVWDYDCDYDPHTHTLTHIRTSIRPHTHTPTHVHTSTPTHPPTPTGTIERYTAS